MTIARKALAALAAFACLHVAALTAHAGETPSGIPFSELENRIDEVVARYLHQTTPGVAIVVVKDGEIVFSRGYGYADVARRIPVDPAATVFELGSIGKTFVWTAVMQLVERGLLDLDANIETYLPEDFARQLNFAMPFTMRDLMNHSAGFADNLFDLIVNADRVRSPGSTTLREGLLTAQPRQIFEPGTISAYSNFGAALAGYVVGHITGRGFAAFERENILVPLSMTNTKNLPDLVGNRAFMQARAGGYAPDGRGGFRRRMWSYGAMYPTGLINGTAEDLARFAIALTPRQGDAGALFSNPDTLATMFAPSALDPSLLRGTYHGFLRYDGVFPSVGHGGNTIAFSSNFAVVPSQRFGFVVLTNVASEPSLIWGIQDLLLGSSPISPAAGSLPSASSVEGNFVTARRTEGTLLEFLPYFMMNRIRAVGENTIRLSLGPYSATYRQVAPYVYRLVSFDAPGGVGMMAYEIHFRMDGGRPVLLALGNGFDLTPLPRGRGMPVLIGSLAATAIGMVFFLVMPVVLLIMFLRKKDKAIARFNFFSNGLMLCGTLAALNLGLFGLRGGVINNFRTFAELAPHVWANYALLALSVPLLVASVVFLIREHARVSARREVLFSVTVSLLALMFVVLRDWNFFALG